ncbi:MAG: nicotinate-nucleotide adenylyltransferase [Saprospiraceae bacterium]|nr:nicotinate-nucleotide adenylyltransferase [Candidatus Vicinibacter affinis]MBK7797628.1 nicotinate-nucleotide adenylyltransferase [Candidatus Vicinibacter affinis]HQX44871.1 nicotinate (nicotinamide) nucleotide adenylyltransferase [Saprospiraceae bacterium]
MQIGLFFGSFNPVHVGHMIIAQHLLNETVLEQVWMVVSPHNPLKNKASLARDYDRLHLVRLAAEGNPKIQVSNIEFSLPKPSYTIDTLTYLKEKYPEHKFALIMGGDNLISLPKWKNYELLLERFQIYIYKRPNYEDQTDLSHHPNIVFTDAPLLDISSTQIREMIKQGKSIRYMVPEVVLEAIENSRLYKS